MRLGAALVAAAGLASGASLLAAQHTQLGSDASQLLTVAQAQAAAAAGSDVAGGAEPLGSQNKARPAAADGPGSAQHMTATATAAPQTPAPGWWARLTGSGAAAAAAAPQPAAGNAGNGGSAPQPAANAPAPTTAATAQHSPANGSGGAGVGGAAHSGSAVQGAEAEAEGWWAWLKTSVGAAPAPVPPVYLPLPTDKLSCKLPADRWAPQRHKTLEARPSTPFRYRQAACRQVGCAVRWFLTVHIHILPSGHPVLLRRRSGAARQPVVLLACGSFNPPTIAHLRMFELAADTLREVSDVPTPQIRHRRTLPQTSCVR